MKILYFSEIRELIGKSEEQIIFKKKINISEIIKLLVSRDENYKKAFESVKNLKCAVNCEYVNSLDTKVGNKDEIAFFPPVTGG